MIGSLITDWNVFYGLWGTGGGVYGYVGLLMS